MIQEPFVEKVLVVEDEQPVRDYLNDLFRIKGYAVKSTATGSEALQMLSEEYFPVIVADLMLPDIRGIKILDYIQEKGLCSAVLIVTAYRSVESVTEALRRGAYDYITKPFTSQVFLHRVDRAMEKIRMENITRNLSSSIVYATEEERRRISRDIHDGIGQSFAIIKLTLKAIRNKLSQKGEIETDIDGLSSYVEEAMEEISRISKNLSPSYVAEVGFSRALSLYLETFSKKTGIQINSSFPEGFSFKHPQQEIHLYRIAQEALINIAKHSAATMASLSLAILDGQIHFSISDDGTGFHESQEGRRHGLGLIGIRERMSILGGKVSIESIPGQGTTIKMEVPYDSTKP